MKTRILRTDTGYQLGKLHASGLSPRECQTLLLRATGASISECALELNIGKSSVQDRVTNMFFKLRADSTPELITKAFQNGFLKFLTLLAVIHLGAATPDNHSFTRVRHTRTHFARIQVRNNNKEFS